MENSRWSLNSIRWPCSCTALRPKPRMIVQDGDAVVGQWHRGGAVALALAPCFGRHPYSASALCWIYDPRRFVSSVWFRSTNDSSMIE